MMLNPCVLKEIDTIPLLIDSLKLRHTCFKHSKFSQNAPVFRMDEYDAFSRHLAVFTPNNQMIGTVRIVENHPGPFFSDFVAGNSDDLTIPPKHPFPLMQYYPFVNDILRICEEAEVKNAEIVEISRLGIHPDFRSLRMVTFMVECIIAYSCIISRKASLIMACSHAHAPFYERYGFKHVSLAHEFKYLEQGSSCMILDARAINPKYMDRIHSLAWQFQAADSICYKRRHSANVTQHSRVG